MARVTLTRTTPLGPHPTLQPAANALDLTLTAADSTNKEQFVLDGPVLIVAHNLGVGARTITLTSVADSKNRTGDVTAFSIGADEIAVFKVDNTEGWKQTDGYMYIEASNAEVRWGIVRLA